LAIPLAADVVHLKNGGKLEGKIVDDAGDTLSLQTRAGGVMQIPKADIDHIEEKPFEVAPKASPPKQAGPSQGDTFEDPIRGYSLTFPKAWHRAPNEKALTYVGPKEPGYNPKIDVMSIPMKGTVEDVATSVKAALDGFKQESEKERELPGAKGHRAIEVIGAFPHPGKPDLELFCAQVTIEAGAGQFYVILAYCTKATFAAHAAEFKATIDSFAITPAANLTAEQKQALSTWLTKAREATSAGKDADAIDAYKKAAEILPAFADIHHNLAVLYLKTKQEAKAIQEYQILVGLRPGSADDQYTLGTLYSKAQKYEDAATSFKKAVEIDPGHASAWNNLGTVLLAKGDVPGAVQALKRAAELSPDDASPLYNLGQAYESSGQNEAAVEAYKKTLERDPVHAGAKAALERLSKPK
ncbi:MAG: tetratricopeptide repeat protein, partial [Planctomycetota bacterium]